ncbi:MAG: NTPase [Acidianus infernus]|nr:NTPase [Acidianus infernus]
MRFFITGKPGVGKTTILMYVVKELVKRNYTVVGFYCPEVREGGRRIGFKIVSIPTGKERWLAKVGEGKIKVGKYAVQDEAEEVVKDVKDSLPKAQVIAIDEIGPMELSIPLIKSLIDEVLKLDKPLIAVVHRNVKLNVDGKTYIVTEENRDSLKEKILNEIVRTLG